MAAPAQVKIDDVIFFTAANAHKSFAEFCEHEKHHGLSEDKLKLAWETMTGKKVKSAKADPPAGE